MNPAGRGAGDGASRDLRPLSAPGSAQDGAGRGGAWGAVTIINATATGRGCSLAIDAATHATWTWQGTSLDWRGKTDDRLATAVLAKARGLLRRSEGARAEARTPFAPARGLKTSSAAATALLRAAADAAGEPLGADLLDAAAVDAAVSAGVTLTGAFDDQVAVSRGGCHVTDNRRRRIEATLDVPPLHVAVWVPHDAVPKARVPALGAHMRDEIDAATEAALAGDVAQAMTRNGAAFLAAYAEAGLPVTAAPVEAALGQGALGAGLSGTGPAVAALFERPRTLPAVPGGVWTWHRSVEGP